MYELAKIAIWDRGIQRLTKTYGLSLRLILCCANHNIEYAL